MCIEPLTPSALVVQRYKVLHDYVRVNECTSDEYSDVELDLIEGELPADLTGVLYRNGNGRFAHQGVWYDHRSMAMG